MKWNVTIKKKFLPIPWMIVTINSSSIESANINANHEIKNGMLSSIIVCLRPSGSRTNAAIKQPSGWQKLDRLPRKKQNKIDCEVFNWFIYYGK